METKKIQQFIEQQHLFTHRDRILVALSGGADSVALLCMLLSLGYECEAAHCNFHLRGEESDRDEGFVRRLCQERQVPLHVTHFDTRQVAAQRHVSIEMAARQLRYDWFESVRASCRAEVVAVAHHADDSVETFLLNLIRGTGINGLRGIRPRNGRIVRPLLCLNRQDVVNYLERIGQPFVTDSTNLQDDYTRNKIRLRLLPLLEELNPSVRDTLLSTARYLDDAASLYVRGIDDGKKRVQTEGGISIEALRQEPAPETLLYELLSPLGFNAARVKDVYRSLDGQSGKCFTVPGWQVVKDRDKLLIAPCKEPEAPMLRMMEYPYTHRFVISHDKRIACLDADKLPDRSFHVRLWQAGDWFIPFGMTGRKLVSDYLTDRKFSLLKKRKQWVLCCGSEIVWLIGERIDNRYRVDEQTQRVIHIQLLFA